jgi:hypothetical protein
MTAADTSGVTRLERLVAELDTPSIISVAAALSGRRPWRAGISDHVAEGFPQARRLGDRLVVAARVARQAGWRANAGSSGQKDEADLAVRASCVRLWGLEVRVVARQTHLPVR